MTEPSSKSRSERHCQHAILAWDATFRKAFCTDCGARFVERALVDETAPVSERGDSVAVPRVVLQRYYDIACGRMIGKLDEIRPELKALLCER